MLHDQQKDYKNFVLVASLLFMIIGTGSVYFLVVALKLISTEFNWPRAVPSFAYALQYFGAGFGSSNITSSAYSGLLEGKRETNVFNFSFELYFTAVPVFPPTS